MDFAPDGDVNTNPANPVIGVRSMGDDPVRVGVLGVEQIRGIQSRGVAATAKHFPGHGDTQIDSHLGLPVVEYGRTTLERHLVPF
ncbi:glycoside hydrolase family 3 N-terminal domain-containing protein, partial [Escherichia coli]|uniref:glycoside hydrolase family 3 N-terminal domain-containing protein n=1 Tax=Escherichia coli TaxID=562 RepID=UPI003D2F228F